MTDILSIGTSATLLYQKSLATVSNNVANLNTEGYSRQEATNVQNYPTQFGVHYLGSGAYLGDIKRNYDQFIERNLRNTLTEMSTHKSMAQYSARLVDAISSDKTALSPAFDRFFSVAEALGLEPNSLPLRADLFSAADFLAGRFQGMAQQLNAIDAESAGDINSKIQEVNSLSVQLADVNRQLLKHSSVQKQPAALLDQRDRLLKALSSFIDAEVTEQANGQVDIRVKSGGPDSFLVLSDKAFMLTAEFDNNRIGSQVLVLDKYGKNLALPNLTGGEITGILSFRRDVLAPLMTQLNILASSFASSVNTINRNGLTLENKAGTDVFNIARSFNVTGSSGLRMENIQVNETDTRQQEYHLSVSWLGDDQWQITDHTSSLTQTITRALDNETPTLNVAGLSIQFGSLPVRGEAFTVRSERFAAQGITLALTDARAFAFAEKYYVRQSSENQQPLETRLLTETVSHSKLSDVLSLSSLTGKNVPVTIASDQYKPSLLVPAGTNEFVVSFQPSTNSDAELQLFTTEFSHLLGSSLDQAQQSNLRDAAFASGSVYLDGNLKPPSAGMFSYRGADFFYGHKTQNFVQSSTLPLLTQGPDGPNAEADPLIPGGSLLLNGRLMPALNIGQSNLLTAQHIADWVNSESAHTGVEASVITTPYTDSLGNIAVDPVTGEQLQQQVVRFTAVSSSSPAIEFSFGANGKPRHLSVLGLSTGLYGNGAAADSLLVYTTGRTEATTLQINVPAQSSQPSAPMLNEELRVTFSKPDGQPLQYQIADRDGVVISQRVFSATNGVQLPGMTLKFDQLPNVGDEFIVEVNANSAGDNRNLLSLIELRNAKIVNQKTFKDYFLDMVNTVGNVKNISSMNLETSEVIYQHAIKQKSMVSGVNLDQEAADLIRFQQAYQAAAQVIQTSIKLFDTLLSSSR